MNKVSLFIPCAVDAVLVSVGEATVRLLARLGFDLIYHEEQTCCGQPAITAGYLDLAGKPPAVLSRFSKKMKWWSVPPDPV